LILAQHERYHQIFDMLITKVKAEYYIFIFVLLFII